MWRTDQLGGLHCETGTRANCQGDQTHSILGCSPLKASIPINYSSITGPLTSLPNYIYLHGFTRIFHHPLPVYSEGSLVALPNNLTKIFKYTWGITKLVMYSFYIVLGMWPCGLAIDLAFLVLYLWFIWLHLRFILAPGQTRLPGWCDILTVLEGSKVMQEGYPLTD